MPRAFPARGLAVGDFDNDGRVDVLVGCNGGAPLLLQQRAAPVNHWVGVKLQGASCNRDAIGARLTWSAGGVSRSRLKNGGGSYLSSHDPREVLGLGTAPTVDWLEIKWPMPSGKTERFTSLPVDRYVHDRRGQGHSGMRRWLATLKLLPDYALVIFLCACRAEPPQPAAQKTLTLTRAVALPDISNADPQVQAQIRQQYTSLQQKISSGAPAAEVADAYGAMGRLFIATEFFDSAAVCLSNAQMLQPNDMHGRTTWRTSSGSETSRQSGHVVRARARAAAGSRAEPRLARRHAPRRRRCDGADAPLRKRSPCNHESPRPSITPAVWRSKRQYQVAVDRLSAAAAAAPQASSVQYPLSIAYRGLGDVKNADAHLRLRGNIDPSPDDPLMRQVSGLLQNASALEVRGADALSKRRWPEAVAALRQALELAPDNAFTHLNLGTALFETGDAAGALAQFREAVRLSPDMAKAHYGIGIVTEAAGRDTEALAAFRAAVNADPDNAEARLSLGDALRRTGHDLESLPQYAAVIKISPSASPAYFGQAMALVRLKRWSDAREALNRATTTFPDQPGFAHALARVLAAAPDDGVRDGRRALAITQSLLKSQQTIELMQTAAMALAEVGRFDEAAQWQRDAIAAAAQSSRRDLDGRLSENLSRYEQRLPCRLPWPNDDAVFRPRPAR